MYFFMREVYDSVPKNSELIELEHRLEYVKGIFNDNLNTYIKASGLDKESIIIFLIDAGKEQIINREKFQYLLIQSIGIPFLLSAISAFQSQKGFTIFAFIAFIVGGFLSIKGVRELAKPEKSLKKMRHIVEALNILSMGK
jgi:hypothetical protein